MLQFRLRQLFAATAVVAIAAALWRSLNVFALIVPATAAFIVVIRPHVACAKRRHWTNCTATVGLLAVAHAWSGFAAYETVGGVYQGYWFFCLMFYTVPYAFCAAGRADWGAKSAALLALLFVAPQIVWTLRLEILRPEVERIVVYAKDEKRQRGRYPDDLSEFRFHYPSSLNFIDYDPHCYSPQDGEYLAVFFWPAVRDVNYCWSERSGWGFDPD